MNACELLLMRARARRAYCKKCRVHIGSKSSGWPNVPVLISNREDYTGNSYKGTHESLHARKSILVLFTRVLGILRLFGFPGMMLLF
jgi:hypothetical protein